MRQVLMRIGMALVAVVSMIGLTAGGAQARSIRQSSGYTGRHVHVAWGGPDVGVVAWTTGTDYVSNTACGSSTAYVDVDAAWNSASLHNGAQLDILFSVQRSDGRRFGLRAFKVSKAVPWPGHPAFDGSGPRSGLPEASI